MICWNFSSPMRYLGAARQAAAAAQRAAARALGDVHTIGFCYTLYVFFGAKCHIAVKREGVKSHREAQLRTQWRGGDRRIALTRARGSLGI